MSAATRSGVSSPARASVTSRRCAMAVCPERISPMLPSVLVWTTLSPMTTVSMSSMPTFATIATRRVSIFLSSNLIRLRMAPTSKMNPAATGAALPLDRCHGHGGAGVLGTALVEYVQVQVLERRRDGDGREFGDVWF